MKTNHITTLALIIMTSFCYSQDSLLQKKDSFKNYSLLQKPEPLFLKKQEFKGLLNTPKLNYNLKAEALNKAKIVYTMPVFKAETNSSMPNHFEATKQNYSLKIITPDQNQ